MKDKKSKDKFKIKLFKGIFTLLFLIFITMYVSEESGYYEFKNNKLSLIRGNDRFYQVWGDNCDKVFYYSSNLLNLIHDDDKDLFVALLNRLKNEKLELGCDNRWKKPQQDEYRWYHQRYKLLLDIEDRCLILGAIEDITVQRQMEDALRYQHDYYKNLFDFVLALVYS